MIERTTGLILRTHPLTETSLIVRWLTRDFGRIATVAKGARRPKSSFRGKLDLFYLAEFAFQRSRHSELHNLREVTLHETHETLRCDLTRLRQAAYASRLIEQVTETETPVPGLFQLFADYLAQLPQQTPRPLLVFAFEAKLLRELGLQPDLTSPRLGAAAGGLLEKLMDMDWPALSQLTPDAAEETGLGQFLHGFLVYQLGKTPRGRYEALGVEPPSPVL